MIERKVVELGGIKSLYSDSFFPSASSTALRRRGLRRAEGRSTTRGAFPRLYDKCVLKA
jgi:hypothetical protein